MFAFSGMWMKLCHVKNPLQEKVWSLLSWHGSYFWVCNTFLFVCFVTVTVSPNHYYYHLMSFSWIFSSFVYLFCSANYPPWVHWFAPSSIPDRVTTEDRRRAREERDAERKMLLLQRQENLIMKRRYYYFCMPYYSSPLFSHLNPSPNFVFFSFIRPISHFQSY